MIAILKNTEKKNEISDFLEKEQTYILKKWESDEFVQTVLSGHNIAPSFFVTHFGGRILSYFIGVLRGENEIGSCPAITALLLFFRQKNIRLEEVFFCCAAFKNIVIATFIEKRGSITEDEVKIISKIFDMNFAGVIHEYLQKRFCRISCAEKDAAHMDFSIDEPAPVSVVPVSAEPKKDVHVYASEYAREEIDEFIDLEDDIVSLSDQLGFDTFSPETIEALAAKLSKYSSIILSNYEFNTIGNSVLYLSKQLSDKENYPFITDNIGSLSLFINCFINDLILWRKSLLETGIEDPHYFDHSISSNVEQIVQMIENRQEIEEGEGFEFF